MPPPPLSRRAAAFLPTAPLRTLHASTRRAIRPVCPRAPPRRAAARRAPAVFACAPPPPSGSGDESTQDAATAPAPSSTGTSPDSGADEEATPTPIAKADPTAERGDIAADVRATLAWVGVAAAAAAAIAQFRGATPALEFVTAYVLEYSLSVDNLFVFLLIFEYFRVPRASQSRVLAYGIGGAVVMRGAMIVAGAALVRRFRFVTLGFAGILLFSAAKLLLDGEDDDEDVANSPIVRFARSLLPFTDRYDGDRFFTRETQPAADGEGSTIRTLATPLMLVLLSVELSDVVFALDSVPAVLGVSDDTLVIYLSNLLAIAGLRNLYFVLSDAIGGLRFLPQALALVLGFVGCKMIAGVAGFDVGTARSLAVVVGTLGGGVALSVALPEEEDEAGGKGDGAA